MAMAEEYAGGIDETVLTVVVVDDLLEGCRMERAVLGAEAGGELVEGVEGDRWQRLVSVREMDLRSLPVGSLLRQVYGRR